MDLKSLLKKTAGQKGRKKQLDPSGNVEKQMKKKPAADQPDKPSPGRKPVILEPLELRPPPAPRGGGGRLVGYG